MSSFPTASAIKCAVEVCTSPQLKREILCASGSEYDVGILSSDIYDRKQEWNRIVKKTATAVLNNPAFKNLCVPDKVQEQIMAFVTPVGTRMLTWAVYHEMTFGFPRECSIKALGSSVFTDKGIVDNKKAVEELMKDDSLSAQQIFKLTCYYCSDSEISTFYGKMIEEDKENLNIPPSGLMKFWSSCLKKEIGKELGGKKLSEHRLEIAVDSGSKVAVEYCLIQKTPKTAVVEAAVKAARLCERNDNLDWIVFRDRKSNGNETSWVPSAYYVDILCFLLSKMTHDHRIKFLEMDIHDLYKKLTYEYPKRSRVLAYFLKYPFRASFMGTAELMWKLLPKDNYAFLLLKICDKIEFKNERNGVYGEDYSYDYRRLLEEFWKRSPESYRRYVLTNRPITYVDERAVMIKPGEGLLVKLLALKNFRHEDGEIMKLILDEATTEERKNIISGEVKNTCTRLLQEEKWDKLNSFLKCFSSEEEKSSFKKELICSQRARLLFIGLLKSTRWNAAESFIEWSALSEKEVNEFKSEVIYSIDGQVELKDLVLRQDCSEVADEILKWCLSSEDETEMCEIETFKKNLISSDNGMADCADLLIKDKTERLDKYIKWCLSSEEEIEKIKKSLAHWMTSFVCKILISNNSEDEMSEVESSKWIIADKIFLGCLSSQEKVSAFKKTELPKESVVDIHFNMIKSRKYEEAKELFQWLGLPAEEIIELKKKTVYSYVNEMMFRARLWDETKTKFECGSVETEETAEFLKWCLTDKKALLEFKDEFNQSAVTRELSEGEKCMFAMFNSVMQPSKEPVKRKFSNLSP